MKPRFLKNDFVARHMQLFFVISTMLLLLIPESNAVNGCSKPIFSGDINKSMRLCGQNYVLPKGLIVTKDNLNIDCSSAVLKGPFNKGTGIIIEDRKNVTLYDCRIVNYAKGFLIKNSSNIMLKNITLLRNMIGVHMYNTKNSRVVNSFDVSLKKPILLFNSTNNVFTYLNKKIRSDFCRYNKC